MLSRGCRWVFAGDLGERESYVWARVRAARESSFSGLLLVLMLPLDPSPTGRGTGDRLRLPGSGSGTSPVILGVSAGDDTGLSTNVGVNEPARSVVDTAVRTRSS